MERDMLFESIDDRHCESTAEVGLPSADHVLGPCHITGALIIGGLGAAAGAYGAHQSRKGMENAAKQSWESTSNPWGPTEDDRTQGLNWNQQIGQDFMNWYGQNNPFAQPAQPLAPVAQGPRGNRGGGGGGGNGSGNGNGQSVGLGVANRMAGALENRATSGHPLYGPANQTAISALQGANNPLRDMAVDNFGQFGQRGHNPYLDEAADTASGFRNPALEWFMANELGFGPGQGGPGYPGGGSGVGYTTMASGGGGGGTVNQNDLVGAAGALRKVIASDPWSVENPAVQRASEAMSRRIQDNYEKAMGSTAAAWAGTGRYGGGLYWDQLADREKEFAQQLGDAESQLQYQLYSDQQDRWNNALNTGTQWDLAQQQLADSAASRSASGASAAADRDQRANEFRQQMMLNAALGYGDVQEFGLNTLMGAANQLGGAQQFGATGLLSAADMFSRDQLGTLGMIPDLTGMDIRDLNAAYGSGLGLEQLDLQRDDMNSRNSIARGQLGLARDSQRLDEQYRALMFPFQMMNAYGGNINSLGGDYGTQYGRGQGGGAVGPSNAQGAMSGALSGLALAQMFQGYGGAGGGQGYGGGYNGMGAAGNPQSGYSYINPQQPWMGSY